MNPPERSTHAAAFMLPGFAAIVGLHALFIIGWTGFFARVPWPGYEESTRLGIVEPWFVNSPRSLWLTRAVLFLLAFALVWPAHRRVVRALALWAGAAAGVILTYATTVMRTFEGGAAGFIFYPVRVGLPILAGSAAAMLVQRMKARTTGRSS